MKTHDFVLVNGDTDSVTIGKHDGKPFTSEERIALLEEINNLMPEKINFSDDGYFPRVCILKAKNYILLDEKGKIKKKGSSLKSSKIEKGLQDFQSEIIDCLIYDKQDQLLDVYNKYIKEVHNVKDISRWCGKRTVTESVLNPERPQEQKQLDALKGEDLQMGNKFWVYFTEVELEETVPQFKKINGEKTQVGFIQKKYIDYPLKLQKHWNNDHSVSKLVAKIYKTLEIFENVINLDQFPKYHLKNKKIQEELNNLIK